MKVWHVLVALGLLVAGVMIGRAGSGGADARASAISTTSSTTSLPTTVPTTVATVPPTTASTTTVAPTTTTTQPRPTTTVSPAPPATVAAVADHGSCTAKLVNGQPGTIRVTTSRPLTMLNYRSYDEVGTGSKHGGGTLTDPNGGAVVGFPASTNGTIVYTVDFWFDENPDHSGVVICSAKYRYDH